MSDFLTPKELVSRWRGSVNIRTLANWRAKKTGPKYIKAGRQILYDVKHVEQWEKENEH